MNKEEIIENIQKEFDKKFINIFDSKNNSKNTENDLSYTNLVIPFVKKLGELIGENPFEWPIYITNKYVINIYYEFLYFQYTSNLCRKKFPLKILIILMIYRPFIYYICCMSIEYSKVDQFRNLILKNISEIYSGGNEEMRPVKKFKEIINLEQIPPEERSAIMYFHFFIGIKFDKSMISISRDEVEKIKKLNDAESILFINILYNSDCYESNIYVYKEMKEKIGTKIITPEVAKNFRPILNSEISKDYKRDKLYEIDKISEKNIVVINYDNKHFTILLNRNYKPLILNSYETKKFIGGGIPILISPEDYNSYAENMYYNSLTKIISKIDINQISIQKPIFATIYYDYIYEKLVGKEIKTKLDLIDFCKSIEVPDNLINPDDLKLFKFYASLYQWEGEFELKEFISHMKSYFE